MTAPLAAEYEAIVVGGGVVGAGVARDLALRGVRTLLLEKRDFSSGTTGTCSGMIHGGLRYLEFDVATTRNSCVDAGYIKRMAPHLIFRIPFLIPVYPGARYGLEIVESVLEAYVRYSPLKEGKPSSRLSADETLSLEPGIAPGLKGALTLDEWGIDPFRLVLANAVDARERGADVRNHAEVTAVDVERGRVVALRVRERGSETPVRVGCRTLVNAAGPWAPRLAAMAGARVGMRPGKGTHVIFSGRVSNYGLISPTIDGRETLLVPHEGCTLLGTTDDDYYGDPDDVSATREEIDYLLESACRVMPELRRHRVMRVMSGVRPTLYQFGPIEDKLPREHALIDHASEGADGLLTITGGKLATYRIMAEEAADLVTRKLGRAAACRTHLLPLPGGEETPDAAELAREHGLDAFACASLVRRHGARARTILAEGRKERDGMAVLCACEGTLTCEARYALRHEMVEDLADLGRRTRVGWGPCQGLSCAYRAAALMAEERSLSAAEAHRLAFAFLESRFKGIRPFCEGPALATQEMAQRAWDAAGLPELFGAQGKLR